MNKGTRRNFNFGLVFLVGFNLLPHLVDHTLPVLFVGGGCIVWRLLFEFQKVRLPKLTVKLFLVLLSMAWVFFNYRTYMGLEAGTAVMIMAISLKLIDHNRYHDTMIILFVTFLILLARVLKSQSLWITLFGAIDLIVVTSLLLQLHSHDKMKFNASSFLINGSKLMLQVSPMMILLFIIFPRISNELSLVPKDLSARSAGISKTISPGDISKIALSDALVFRAKAVGLTHKLTRYRYWKGSVLSSNSGMIWSRPPREKNKVNALPSRKNVSVISDHQVILEPGYGKWLFALDSPLSINLESESSKQLKIEKDGVFSLRERLNKKVLYTAQSGISGGNPLSISEREKYLQAPSEADIRIHFLVSEIINQTKNNIEVARNLLNFYRYQFKYDIDSSIKQSHQLSTFVFDQKVGFSEHFANSFAAILRLAGVPARVVVGFHGGEGSRFDEYVSIRDKDIHAWSEVWSDEKMAWIRFDPTMVIAPLRLKLGGQLYHRLSSDQLKDGLSASEYWDQVQGGSWSYASLAKIKSAFQSISTRWSLFLLNYNEKGQREFLKKLGIDNLKNISLFLISLMVLVLFYFFVRRQSKESIKISKNDKLYQELCDFLRQKGIEKEIWEGPVVFFSRVCDLAPGGLGSINSFKSNYISWRYSPYSPTSSDLKKQKINLNIIRSLNWNL